MVNPIKGSGTLPAEPAATRTLASPTDRFVRELLERQNLPARNVAKSGLYRTPEAGIVDIVAGMTPAERLDAAIAAARACLASRSLDGAGPAVALMMDLARDTCPDAVTLTQMEEIVGFMVMPVGPPA